MERNIAVIVSFTAGMALIMDAGVILAIVTQVGFILLQAVLLRNPSVSDLQPVIVNVALLVFLIKNLSDTCAESAAKEDKAKAELAAAEAKQEPKGIHKTVA